MTDPQNSDKITITLQRNNLGISATVGLNDKIKGLRDILDEHHVENVKSIIFSKGVQYLCPDGYFSDYKISNDDIIKCSIILNEQIKLQHIDTRLEYVYCDAFALWQLNDMLSHYCNDWVAEITAIVAKYIGIGGENILKMHPVCDAHAGESYMTERNKDDNICTVCKRCTYKSPYIDTTLMRNHIGDDFNHNKNTNRMYYGVTIGLRFSCYELKSNVDRKRYAFYYDAKKMDDKKIDNMDNKDNKDDKEKFKLLKDEKVIQIVIDSKQDIDKNNEIDFNIVSVWNTSKPKNKANKSLWIVLEINESKLNEKQIQQYFDQNNGILNVSILINEANIPQDAIKFSNMITRGNIIPMIGQMELSYQIFRH